MMKLGEKVTLQKQTVEVVECNHCQAPMVNVDAKELAAGDLVTLKRLGVRLSNPQTTDPTCFQCEVAQKPSFREKVSKFFDSDDDNDSHLFGGGSSGYGGGGSGGFGGFGGGSFSGGGASSGF